LLGKRNASGPAPPAGGQSVAHIGKSIVIKGDLSGDEDMEIDGQVEGRIQLPGNQVTIGANGIIEAEIDAKAIVVIGKVDGNLRASERLEIQSTGVVNGDIRAPKLLIQEGAVVNGGIEMTQKDSAGAQKFESKDLKSTKATATAQPGAPAPPT
jgi:cytoskeletal protein CcmA (bactofilin family)